jgi:TonB family protein
MSHRPRVLRWARRLLIVAGAMAGPHAAAGQGAPAEECDTTVTAALGENPAAQADVVRAVAAAEGREAAAALVPLDGRGQMRLTNPRVVVRALQQAYPRYLRDSRVDGQVSVLIRVGTDGRVARSAVAAGARAPAFDDAALRVVQAAEFEPAQANGCRMAAWAIMPVVFESRRGAGPRTP